MDALKQILAHGFEVKISFDFGSYTVTAIFDGEEWNWWSGPDLEKILLTVEGWAETVEDEVNQVDP